MDPKFNEIKQRTVFVEIIVEDRSFYIPLHRLMKFPDSYFCAALKPHWNNSNGIEDVNSESKHTSTMQKLYVNGRDPELFRFIAMYLEFGCVPRNDRGVCLIDPTLLEALLDEADYFCLTSLVAELNTLLNSDVYESLILKNIINEEAVIGKILLNASAKKQTEENLDIYCLDVMMNQTAEGLNYACKYEDCKSIYNVRIDSVPVFDRHNYTYVLQEPYKAGKIQCDLKDLSLIALRCAVGLSLDINSIIVKPILIQYLFENNKKYTVEDTDVVAEGDILGYYDLTYGFDEVYRRSAVCYFKKYEIPVKPSKRLLTLRYAIVKQLEVEYSRNNLIINHIDDVTNLISTSVGPRRSIIESLQVAHNRLFDFMMRMREFTTEDQDVCSGVVGVFTAHKYFVSSSGLKASSLEGCDSILYEAAVSRGIPVSLVYVKVSSDYVSVLDIGMHSSHRDIVVGGAGGRRRCIPLIASSDKTPAYHIQTSKIGRTYGKFTQNVVRSLMIIGDTR